MTHIALFAILIGICSWITIPGAVPFTLQTFGVFLAVSVLGGKRGTAAVLLYIFIGLIGIPVFSGFRGGIGVLLGNTGGYILGFIFSALLMWLFEIIWKRRFLFLSMILSLLVCYTFGTLWFLLIYTGDNGVIGITTILSWCVLPFIIPDFLNIFLAFLLGKQLRKILSRM